MDTNDLTNVERALRLTAGALFLWLALAISPVAADSSSALLAAYYDRQMAIVGGRTYYWRGKARPKKLPFEAVQTGIGRSTFYALTRKGDLVSFRRNPERRRVVMAGVARFAAGASGVLAIAQDGALWWIATGADARVKIAEGVVAAAVGDGANYYVTGAGDLFVKGKAHRGQYGDGRLEPSDRFVKTAAGIKQITAHTGHAIALTRDGDVLGTGGNIYGPVGRHGLGDKAVRWSRITAGAGAIATGASHSAAIRRDGTLIAWGSDYGPEPVPVLAGVAAVAAGSHTTIALRRDGSLWQWTRGERPRRVVLPE